ncbi:MAG TPA: extracellular solute-binding protein, partial [Candidatus Limnocylindrales bacterium]
YIAVPVTSKNPATAAAFAQFLLNAENQTKWCQHPKVVIFPTTTASLSDPFFTSPKAGDGAFGKARQVAAAAATGAKADALMAIWSGAIGAPVTAELQLAIKGDKDPAQALKDAQDKANQILAQVK